MNTDHGPALSSRALWAAMEPFVLGFLFARESRTALSELGIEGPGGYFAIRAAPLGHCPSAVVASALHGFRVSVISAYLPSIWDRVAPEAVIEAHHVSLPATAARVFGDTIDVTNLVRAGDLLTAITAGLDTAGRPLAAGNQAIEAPPEPWARFWHACTTLREYRGDGHIARLISADLTVAESLALSAVWARDHIDADLLRTSRQLSDQSWSDARAALAARGLLTAHGGISAAGAELREQIEYDTDIASQRPWNSLRSSDLTDVYGLSTALSSRVIDAGVMRSVTPVGAPWPPPALND